MPASILSTAPDSGRPGQPHRPRAWRGGMERSHHRHRSGAEGQQGDARRDRFVHVQQVEVLVAAPSPGTGRDERAETDPRDRSVVAHRQCGSGSGEVLGVKTFDVAGQLAGSQHVRVVAVIAQVCGQAQDVVLDAAGDVQRVRADQSDPQSSKRAHRAGPVPKKGCIRCQSSGWSDKTATKKSATAWVIATKPSRPG